MFTAKVAELKTTPNFDRAKPARHPHAANTSLIKPKHYSFAVILVQYALSAAFTAAISFVMSASSTLAGSSPVKSAATSS